MPSPHRPRAALVPSEGEATKEAREDFKPVLIWGQRAVLGGRRTDLPGG